MFTFVCAVAILGTIGIDIIYTYINKSTEPLVVLSSIIGWGCAAIYLYQLMPH